MVTKHEDRIALITTLYYVIGMPMTLIESLTEWSKDQIERTKDEHPDFVERPSTYMARLLAALHYFDADEPNEIVVQTLMRWEPVSRLYSKIEGIIYQRLYAVYGWMFDLPIGEQRLFAAIFRRPVVDLTGWTADNAKQAWICICAQSSGSFEDKTPSYNEFLQHCVWLIDSLEGMPALSEMPTNPNAAVDVQEALHRQLATLTPREETVLRYRFGIGLTQCTYKKIGKEFGVSGVRIQQIEATALYKLQLPIHARPVLAAIASIKYLEQELTKHKQREALEEGAKQFSWATDIDPHSRKHLLRRVDEFELSLRSANALRRVGIHYIWQLVSKTESYLLKTKNFGRRSMKELQELVKDLGLHLEMQFEDTELQMLANLTTDA